MNSTGLHNTCTVSLILIGVNVILTGGLIHSLTMTEDYQSVHINRNSASMYVC